MSSIFESRVSVYKNAMSTDAVNTSLHTFLTSKRHLPEIKRLRAETDKVTRDNLKKHLPAATISGTFARRAVSGIEVYNGLVCLDFDGKDNQGWTPDDMKAVLCGFEETAYCGLSVGGQGVFAIIQTNNTDPAQHYASVEVLGQILKGEGLTFDKSCKDVCRLRFVSHDPEPYMNPDAATFDVLSFFRAAQERETKPRAIVVTKSEPVETAHGTMKERVERVINHIEQNRIDITDNYREWLKLGFAIAAEFGTNGEEYFVRLSQFHPKFDQNETAKKYQEFTRNRKNVGIGTFFHIVKNHGLTL